MTWVDDIFQIGVGPWTGSQPDQEIAQFDSVEVDMHVDNGCTVSFGLKGDSPSSYVIDELATDVWVYMNGVPFVRTRITEVNQEWGPSGEDIVEVTSVCYKTLLNARHMPRRVDFASVLQGEIMWSLINDTQTLVAGGDMGITYGTVDSGGISRDRSYEFGENIGRLLENLSGVINGLAWGVDGLLRFNAQPWTAFPTQGTPVARGVTARTLVRNSGAAGFANAVFVAGDGEFTEPIMRDVGGGGLVARGRWERHESFPSVVVQSTLDEKADGILETANSPLATWSVEVEPFRWLSDAQYLPGDFVTVVVPPSVVAPVGTPILERNAQVLNVKLSVDAKGELSIEIEAAEI